MKNSVFNKVGKLVTGSFLKEITKTVLQIDRISKGLDRLNKKFIKLSKLVSRTNLFDLNNLDKYSRRSADIFSKNMRDIRKLTDLRSKEGRSFMGMVGKPMFRGIQQLTTPIRGQKPINISKTISRYIIMSKPLDISKIFDGDKLSRISNGFKQLLGKIKNLSAGATSNFITMFTSFGLKLVRFLPQISVIIVLIGVLFKVFKKMFKLNIGGMQTMIGKVSGVFKSHMGKLNVKIIQLFRKLDPIIRPIVNLIGNTLVSALDGVFWVVDKIIGGVGLMIDIGKKFTAGWNSMWASAILLFTKVIDKITSLFGVAETQMSKSLKNFANSLLSNAITLYNGNTSSNINNNTTQRTQVVKNYNVTFNTNDTVQEDTYLSFARRFMNSIV